MKRGLIMAESKPLTSKTAVAIAATTRLQDERRRVLDLLYQPILGVAAYSLATVMWQQVSLTADLKVEVTHTDLLALLNISMSTLKESRQRLEGAGLLRTFENQPDRLPELIYELQQPVSGEMFFKDDLLSLLLLEVVGERQFDRLRQAFLPRQLKRDKWHEVSKSFLDVFSLDNRLIAAPPKLIEATKAAFSQGGSSVELEQPTAPDFDFGLLSDLLKRSYTDLSDLRQYRQLIINEHLLYGIDETEMARYIGDATNLATNKLDADQFKRAIAAAYQNEAQAVVSAKKNVTAAKSSEGTEEAALVTAAKQYEPMAFLAQIRQQQGGYVASGEQRIVEQIANKQIFSSAVINILIYEVLIDLDNPTITQRLTDTIANRWAQDGVKTPEDALASIRKFKAERDKPKNSRRRRSTKNIKETLPDWAKNDYQPQKKKALSQSDQDQFNEQLNKLKKLRDGGD
ncbi:replicative DNA helicase [Secundilactobacillus pentosiphilus]|uniref:Replicative DNA helicase n=2 Tax=Secundilactobacillus pentosiphilus TaxID=1714682 RepID=A0A1Z5IMN1_9LACO|nr:replicative DNA helicase [Secundilactobacillus pentosiphilus]